MELKSMASGVYAEMGFEFRWASKLLWTKTTRSVVVFQVAEVPRSGFHSESSPP